MPRAKTKKELAGIIKHETNAILADSSIPTCWAETEKLVTKAIRKGMSIGLTLANEQFMNLPSCRHD